ncbi:MAG: hypothetical protein ABSF82_04525 [Candidatus Bathyarchaeia archaeon]
MAFTVALEWRRDKTTSETCEKIDIRFFPILGGQAGIMQIGCENLDKVGPAARVGLVNRRNAYV